MLPTINERNNKKNMRWKCTLATTYTQRKKRQKDHNKKVKAINKNRIPQKYWKTKNSNKQTNKQKAVEYSRYSTPPPKKNCELNKNEDSDKGRNKKEVK